MFSSTMAELYARAADTGPREFLEEAVQLVRRLIGFDGAVFGIEDADAMRVKDLVIDKAFADRIVASLRGDYVDVAISNFMPRAFCSAPGRPIAFDRKNLDGKLALSPWCDFAREHGIRRLLLYGDLPTEHYNARWIVLYRLEGPDFQEAEAQLLQAAWRHLRQAIAFNLSCALYRSDLHRRTRAMALIHSDGHVEIANKAMTELKRRVFDVLIIDDALDGMDGVAFTRKLRACTDCQNRYVPIIMMSAAPDARRIAEARDAGVTEFLRKPFAANHLQTRLDSIAANPRSFIEAEQYKGPDRRRRTVDVGEDRRETGKAS